MSALPAFYFSEKFFGHACHPEMAEKPARLRWTLEGLAKLGDAVELTKPVPADEKILLLAHSREYIERVKKVCELGAWLDIDTYTCSDTFQTALLAASAAVQAVDGKESSFVLCRPPGHHAPSGGFCIFNNVAIAAKALLRQGKKVFIFDFDCHHGNGTQALLQKERRVFYCSTHQWPFYPGSGGPAEQWPNVLNIPLPAGTHDALYARVLEELVRPAAQSFDPDVVLLSAGFDSYYADQNVEAMGLNLQLTSKSYAAIARLFKDYPQHYVLEGGYSRESLSNGALAIGAALLGKRVALKERPRRRWRLRELFGELLNRVVAARRAL